MCCNDLIFKYQGDDCESTDCPECAMGSVSFAGYTNGVCNWVCDVCGHEWNTGAPKDEPDPDPDPAFDDDPDPGAGINEDPADPPKFNDPWEAANWHVAHADPYCECNICMWGVDEYIRRCFPSEY